MSSTVRPSKFEAWEGPEMTRVRIKSGDGFRLLRLTLREVYQGPSRIA